MRARSRPKGGQDVQNEPRGVPEASRKPPKVTKKLQGGAGVDLVMVYKSKWEPKGILEAARASKISPSMPESMKYQVKIDMVLNVPKPEKTL